VWDVAREPKLAEEYLILTSVESFLLGHASAWDEMNVHKATIDYLRGERYRDHRLEILLAQLRVEATLRGEQGVRDRLLETLELHPDSPLAPRSFLELARIAALQGDLSGARLYFSKALERLWEPELRAAAYYGRAKALMEGGRPREALRDYQEALQLAASPKYRALAHWGLGVALERSGNLNAAFRELNIATSIAVHSTAFAARTVLDLPDVTFAPDFDRYYYKGLAAMAEADADDVLPQAMSEYQTAAQYFERYLSEAESAQHLYAPNARRLHKACVERGRELREQEAREAKARDQGDRSLDYEP
jgi:tetratricopeptide (TPR) repeat protein